MTTRYPDRVASGPRFVPGFTQIDIVSRVRYRDEWPLLIVCPAGVRKNWEAELERWLGTDLSLLHDDDAAAAPAAQVASAAATGPVRPTRPLFLGTYP